MKEGATIGQVAKELRLNPRTIRYYEQIGLLPRPRTSESGYRLYSDRDTERLRLVMKAKLLGLSLAEVRELVEYAIDGRCNALEHRLLALIEAKLEEIDRRMRDLATFQNELVSYRHDLSGRLSSACYEERTPASSSLCSCIGDELKV